MNIRLKDLLMEAVKVNRFIEQNRDPYDALRFIEVMEYFETLMKEHLFSQREIHKRLQEDQSLTEDQRKDFYEKEMLILKDADIKHHHIAVPAMELTTPISIDVLNALIRLGVISG